MSTVALAIGLVVGNILHPGEGLTLTRPTRPRRTEQAAEGEGDRPSSCSASSRPRWSRPSPSGSVLQTLLVALLVGFALQAMGTAGEPILRGIEHLQRLVFRILAMIMWAAPIGAFGAIAAVVGETGWDALKSLAVIMLGFYATCALFVFVRARHACCGSVAGVNLFSLLRYLGREFLLILSTSSSESALPRLIAKMEHLGVSKPVVGITVPTGYSFNLDGTAIYLTMASLFIADALGKPAVGRRADLAAAVHDHRLEGRGRRHRRRPGHAGRRPAVAPAGTGRRRRPDRRHRPVHVRGPGADQLRRQRGRHRAGRHLDQASSTATQADRVLAGEDPFDEATMLDDHKPAGGDEEAKPQREPAAVN